MTVARQYRRNSEGSSDDAARGGAARVRMCGSLLYFLGLASSRQLPASLKGCHSKVSAVVRWVDFDN